VLHVHYSNRAECLREALGAALLGPSASPLDPERVVVPHLGVGRWIALGLARERGIAANLRFQLPAAFVWEMLGALVPGLPARSPFNGPPLRLAVLGRLPQVAPSAREVGDYLAGADGLMAYELATRIARCLDTYLVYRPDWIRAWEAGRERHWQARLWRDLVRIHGSTHWVAAGGRLRAALAAGARPDLGGPVHVFALSAFSPAYLELLAEISESTEIHFYVLNPCREYWGDLIPARVAARRAGAAEPEALYYARGNPLLASLCATICASDIGLNRGENRRTPPTWSAHP
jgi:exodeoxyribonuclease V gamma subunit